MPHKTRRLCLFLLLALTAVGVSRANTIQVGTWNGGSAEPFGDDSISAYQQLYSSTDFTGLSGPVIISELDFFIDPNAISINNNPVDNTLQPYAGQFQVTLSEYAPGSITDLASNVLTDTGAAGANSVATLSLTTDPGTGLVTAGTLAVTLNNPFTYDPTQDLLLDVQPAGTLPWTLFALQADSTLNSAWVGTYCSTASCSGPGLVTQFVETPVPSSVPEPSPLPPAAAALGLLALLYCFGKRRFASATIGSASLCALIPRKIR
jgi:hypothetical protein